MHVAIVDEVGVYHALARSIVVPGDEAALHVAVLEVVTEVIMAGVWADEEGAEQKVGMNHEAGDERPPRAEPNREVEANRGKEQAALVERMVPVAVDERSEEHTSEL